MSRTSAFKLFRAISNDEHKGRGVIKSRASLLLLTAQTTGRMLAEMKRPRLLLVVALCVAGGSATAADTASRPLCDFVQKVLAARGSEFSTLKGEAQNPAVFKNEVFHGTLLPSPGTECTLFVRAKVGSAELEPKYSCTLAKARNFATAKPMFDRAVADLRACFAQANFDQSFDGDGRDPSDAIDWTLTANGPGYRLELQMSNMISLIAGQLGQGLGDPEVEISIDVTDISAPKTPI